MCAKLSELTIDCGLIRCFSSAKSTEGGGGEKGQIPSFSYISIQEEIMCSAWPLACFSLWLIQSITFRGLLAKDLVFVNHGQVTRTIPELATPAHNFHTPPTGGCLSLDIFKVHRLTKWRVFSGIELELMTRHSLGALSNW
ncbi:hypothetical protein TNCV_1494301 [Trichonephila clavipes]|nr:hypothetical protein TNCV_1494301 [Trichonephila clavipes]